jgi:hypothetical protein
MLALVTALCVPAAMAAGEGAAGARGAEIYCYMRRSGNGHEVSWNAAYALIKRQKSSLFKTSPEHAAVMITEAVVGNPSGFQDCGRYLGALFGGSKGNLDAALDSVSRSGGYAGHGGSGGYGGTGSQDDMDDFGASSVDERYRY